MRPNYGIAGEFLFPDHGTLENVSDIYGKLKFVGWGDIPFDPSNSESYQVPISVGAKGVLDNDSDENYYARWGVDRDYYKP